MDDRAEILSRLKRLGELMQARDPAIVDELWNERGFRPYGSEAGEGADTRAGLVRLFEGLYARPFRIRWRWIDPAVAVAGEIAWLSTEGKLELIYPDRVESQPYRLVAVFEKTGGLWRWRLFSGSEPATAAPH